MYIKNATLWNKQLNMILHAELYRDISDCN